MPSTSSANADPSALGTPEDAIPRRRSLVSVLAGVQLALIPLLIFTEAYGWVPHVFGGVLLAAVGVEVAVTRTRLVAVPISMRLYAAWVLWCGMTLVVMPTSAYSVGAFLTLAKIALLTLVFTAVANRRGELLTVLGITVIGMVLVAAVNYRELLELRRARAVGELVMTARLSGKTANNVAIFSVLAGWAALAAFFGTAGKVRYLYLLALPLVLEVVAYCGSRKGLFAVALSVPLLYWYPLREIAAATPARKILVRLCTLALLGAAVGWMLTSPYAERLRGLATGGYELSARQRRDLLDAGVRVWARHPVFGVGFEQFRAHTERYGAPRETGAHSSLVETLAATGLIGFVLHFGMLAMLWRELRKAVRLQIPPRDRAILNCGCALVVLTVFFSVFGVMYGDRGLWPVLAMFAGYACHVTRRASGLPEIGDEAASRAG